MISQCMDMDFVNDFMTLPEVRRYAAEYGAEDEAFITDSRNAWLSYLVNDQIVGLINIHIITGCAAQFHPYILRKFKNDYDNMVQEFFQWFVSSGQDTITKLNVVIPDICKGALKAANNARMTIEGVDRDSWLTENGPCGRIMLGITLKELVE
jgi:hypothetical protein